VDEPIGYMVYGMVYCFACCFGITDKPIYEGNILPYSQKCGTCGEVLVKGKTEVQLFERRRDG
jgi:hypothetical protein